MFNPSLASETRQQVWNATFVYRKISYLPAVLGIRVVSPGYNNIKEEGVKGTKFNIILFLNRFRKKVS